MARCGAWRIPGRLRTALALLLGTAGMALFAGQAPAASLVTGSYQLDWSQDVDKTATGTQDTRKLKQNLELKYKGFLNPVVQNEISVKFEQEVNSNAPDVTRILPVLDLAFKGKYWDAKAGAKRTHENSDDPGKNPKITNSFFLELLYAAPRRVPDLKAKYTLDKDFEEGTTDTQKQGIALSSVYRPTDWLDVKGDYSRDESDDRLRADADTEEERSSAAVGIRHLISEKIKFDAQYTVEETRGATLLDAGGVTNRKEDEVHTAKSALSFRPFRTTSFDGSYDFNLKQNIENGEHTLTANGKVAALQEIGELYDVKGDFSRNITEARHTQDDNTKTEDVVTVEFKAKLSKLFDVSLKYQEKDTVEDHVDPTKNRTSGTASRGATWNGDLTRFWKASASYDRTSTLENEAETVVDTKYSLKSTFDFKPIHLTLDPSYDVTVKDDRIVDLETETRDFKLKVAWAAVSTRYIDAKGEHTYGRKTDSALRNIQRTDNSTGNLSLKNTVPGWTFAIDLTRAATDTSGDDLPPDINSTFGFKADYKYEWLALNTSFKYDKKSLAANSETFDAKASWSARKWDVSLTYTFDKTFSAALDEKYSISLSFKYNL